jgi:hypothetical protein
MASSHRKALSGGLIGVVLFGELYRGSCRASS